MLELPPLSLLKAKGIEDSWETLRGKMENQQRVTVALECEDEITVHLRKPTQAEPEQKRIYDALGASSWPGGSQKTFIGLEKLRHRKNL
ncbi:MAG: hypothetical protein ABFS45_22710 [Pseudomonadota bacterium]